MAVAMAVRKFGEAVLVSVLGYGCGFWVWSTVVLCIAAVAVVENVAMVW